MIRAAIVGLGRWGKTIVDSVQGKSGQITFVAAARDDAALVATLHFPHFRLTGGRIKVWERPDSYLEDFYARAGKDWHYSAYPWVILITHLPSPISDQGDYPCFGPSPE